MEHDEYPDGQLCPYDDCCHNLALPRDGWYTCGHCKREFWCREWEGDYEDYVCYLPDKCEVEPLRPEIIPVAEDLGPSWGTPGED